MSRREVLVLGTFKGAAQAAIQHAHDDTSLLPVFQTNADAAIRILDDGEWRALVVDLTTPGATRLCHEARARRTLFRVPLIALTPRLTDLAVSNALRAGADDVVALGTAEPLRARLAGLPRERLSLTDPSRGEVVIADGERGRCDVLGRVLANAGYQVRYATDVVTARFYAQRSELALYILNSELCDARELIGTARAASDFPWIVTTPQIDVGAVRRALAPFARVAVMSAHCPPENLLFVLNSLCPDTGASRRSGQRALHGSIVLFRSAGQDSDECGFTYSVSARGAYIRTLLPAPHGDVWLEATPPAKTRRVRLLARVAWSRRFGEAGAESAPAGFGLRIVDGLGQDLRLWEEGFKQLVLGDETAAARAASTNTGGFRVPLPSNRPPRPRRAITMLRGSAMVPSSAATVPSSAATVPSSAATVPSSAAEPPHDATEGGRVRGRTMLGMGLLSDAPPKPEEGVAVAASTAGRTLPGMPAPRDLPPVTELGAERSAAVQAADQSSNVPAFERLSASELLSWPPDSWPAEAVFRAPFGSTEPTSGKIPEPSSDSAPMDAEEPAGAEPRVESGSAPALASAPEPAIIASPDAGSAPALASAPEPAIVASPDAVRLAPARATNPEAPAPARTTSLEPPTPARATSPEPPAPASGRDDAQFALACAASSKPASPLPQAGSRASRTQPATRQTRRSRASASRVWTLGALVALSGVFGLALTSERFGLTAPTRATPQPVASSSPATTTPGATRASSTPSPATTQESAKATPTTPVGALSTAPATEPSTQPPAQRSVPATPLGASWALSPARRATAGVPPPPPGGLAEDLAWLYVRAPGAARVYVHGVDYGLTNGWLQTKCGMRFVRLGTAPGRWLSNGLPTRLRCRRANVLRATESTKAR